MSEILRRVQQVGHTERTGNVHQLTGDQPRTSAQWAHTRAKEFSR
jgi:hypothetical protein